MPQTFEPGAGILQLISECLHHNRAYGSAEIICKSSILASKLGVKRSDPQPDSTAASTCSERRAQVRISRPGHSWKALLAINFKDEPSSLRKFRLLKVSTPLDSVPCTYTIESDALEYTRTKRGDGFDSSAHLLAVRLRSLSCRLSRFRSAWGS